MFDNAKVQVKREKKPLIKRKAELSHNGDMTEVDLMVAAQVDIVKFTKENIVLETAIRRCSTN